MGCLLEADHNQEGFLPAIPEVVYKGEFGTRERPFNVAVNQELLGKLLVEELNLSPEQVAAMKFEIDSRARKDNYGGLTSGRRKNGRRVCRVFPGHIWDLYLEYLSTIRDLEKKTRLKFDPRDLFLTKRIPDYIKRVPFERAEFFLLNLSSHAAERLVFKSLLHESCHGANLEQLRCKMPATYFLGLSAGLRAIVFALDMGLMAGVGRAIAHGYPCEPYQVPWLSLGYYVWTKSWRIIEEQQAEKFSKKITRNPFSLEGWRDLVRVDFDKELMRQSFDYRLAENEQNR